MRLFVSRDTYKHSVHVVVVTVIVTKDLAGTRIQVQDCPGVLYSLHILYIPTTSREGLVTSRTMLWQS